MQSNNQSIDYSINYSNEILLTELYLSFEDKGYKLRLSRDYIYNETLDEYWRIIPMIGVNGNECHEILITKGNHSKRVNVALLRNLLMR
jgi:hypothetical protein